MDTFFTDLNRHIAAYEAGERADEIDRDMMAESSDYAVNGEAASLIPAHDMTDADEPSMILVGFDFAIVPGADGNTKFLP